MKIFSTDRDYLAFEETVEESLRFYPLRILGYCWLPICARRQKRGVGQLMAAHEQRPLTVAERLAAARTSQLAQAGQLAANGGGVDRDSAQRSARQPAGQRSLGPIHGSHARFDFDTPLAWTTESRTGRINPQPSPDRRQTICYRGRDRR